MLTMKMVREFGGPEVLTYDDWIENFHAAPELKELKGFLGKLKVVKNWDDSNWEWLQRF